MRESSLRWFEALAKEQQRPNVTSNLTEYSFIEGSKRIPGKTIEENI